MLDWLYELIGTMLSWFSIGGSYAVGLLFYALVFKLLFLPFSIKQQKNQIKMAKLTPKLELIKAKYRGRTDQQTQQKMSQRIHQIQNQIQNRSQNQNRNQNRNHRKRRFV